MVAKLLLFMEGAPPDCIKYYYMFNDETAPQR